MISREECIQQTSDTLAETDLKSRIYELPPSCVEYAESHRHMMTRCELLLGTVRTMILRNPLSNFPLAAIMASFDDGHVACGPK